MTFFLISSSRAILSLNIGECVSDFHSAIQCAGYNVRNQVLVLTGSVLFS